MLNVITMGNGEIRFQVNGITLKGKYLPKVGMSAVRHVGSDTYAYKVAEVSPDYTWYRLTSGEIAVLVTRKNSRRVGQYVSGTVKNGKAIPGPTPYYTCMNFETFWLVNYEAKDILDPSF